MCAKLGIRIIAASSPQAKGRVERNHGTHQDRLIKKMRLKLTASLAEGNRFLRSYLADHNRRFANEPQAVEDYHTTVPEGFDLDAVFRLEETRVPSAMIGWSAIRVVCCRSARAALSTLRLAA